MSMTDQYNLVCEWLHQLEMSGTPTLSKDDIDRLFWHRKRMESSMNAVNKNSKDVFRSLCESDFAVSFKKIKEILNK